MLVVFFSYFLADTKIISRHDFVAPLSRSNISFNITKMPCWMKCWISLTQNAKISKKEKIMLDGKKSCWVKM